MANKRDANTGIGQPDGYSLAGAIRFAYEERRWVLAGGDDDAEALYLHIILQAPDQPELVKRYEIRLSIRADGDDLIVGDAEVAPV